MLLLLFSVIRTKTIRRALGAALALILSLGVLAPAPAAAQSSLPGLPALSVLSSLLGSSLGGDPTSSLAVGDRDVLVSLPPNYNPDIAHPVLLAFSGRGTSPEEASRTLGLRANSGAIIAYARGVGDTWAGAPYSQTTVDGDVTYARGIVDAIAARHPVDRDRVYAIGHSNGGAFALNLACRAPELLAGVVSVSGMFYTEADQGCWGGNVPAMLIHSTSDDVAVYGGGVRHGAAFLSVDEMFQRWGARNSCQLTRADLPSGAGRTHQAWTNCLAETELVVSPSAGHPWPGYAPSVARDFLARQNR